MLHPKAENRSSHVHPDADVHAFVVIEADAIVGPGAIIRPHAVLRTGCRIGAGALIGESAVVLEGVNVGPNAEVLPGSVVRSDIPEGTVVQGNPARPLLSIPDGIVHPQAIVESRRIGAGTRIWAFCHILPEARIGRDVNLCDHTFVENDVVIGDRVTVKCGVQLWDGLRIEDDVFIGPNVTLTNDRFPRSRHYLERYPETRICRGASIGANATILPGITIGECAMIGAGAVVLSDVPAYAVAVGNPARVIRQLSPSDNHSP